MNRKDSRINRFGGIRRMAALALLAVILFAAGAALADSWSKQENGTWVYLDDEGNEVRDYSAMGSITIPAEVDKLAPEPFYNVGKAFYIRCEPGSYAETFALKRGLQYDNGQKQVIGYQITNANEKAKWIVENYTDSSMTDEEKALRLHAWLRWNAAYDYTYREHSAYGVLVSGTGVCESYARAMQMMLNYAKVPNRYMSGTANNNSGNGYEGHAWNLIQIGGRWYHVDTTWGLFMLTDEQIGYDHHWSGQTNSTGFVQVGDKVCYYDENGQKLTGLQQIARTDYDYDMEAGDWTWKYQDSTKIYYFDAGGVMQKNALIEVDGKKYYFGPEGNADTDTSRVVDGKQYYFGSDGAAVTGFRSTNYGTYYYLPDGSMLEDGWIEDGGYRYHISAGNGSRVDQGRTEIDGDTYYFDSKGRMKTGIIRYCYYGPDGKAASGWVTVNGNTYYFDPELYRWEARRNGMYEIDGKGYSFDASGKMQRGLVKHNSSLYFFAEDGTRQTGWQTVDGNKYYFGEYGYAVSGFNKLDGKDWREYYFDRETCRMQTGLVSDISEYEGTRWFFYGEDGRVLRSTWISLPGGKAYANAEGRLLTGRYTIGDDTYFFNSSGIMQTGLIPDNGELYLFGPDGKQLRGWQVVNGDTYCFNGSWGSAVRGQTYSDYSSPDPYREYVFDENGKLQGEESKPSETHTHVLEEIPAREASCTQTGLTVGYRCAECGEIVSPQAEIPEKHKPVQDDAVYPTATKTGLTAGSHCELCGKVLKAQEVVPMQSQTARFVERCYSLILNRAADQAGLEDWTHSLELGKNTASEIIQGFLFSAEYLGREKASEETVEILYQTMLDRPSDEAGKAQWVSLLEGGSTENSVINGFCGSQEFTNLCADYGIEAGSVEDDSEAVRKAAKLKEFVERCYTEALSRGSDPAGMESWCSILENKEQTPQQVAAGFIYSPEMNAAEKIVSDPDTLLDSLYRLYLGRPADEAGKESWKQSIANGLTLEELNYGFAYSNEFREIVESYGLGN